MKTYTPKADDIQRSWWVVDAAGDLLRVLHRWQNPFRGHLRIGHIEVEPDDAPGQRHGKQDVEQLQPTETGRKEPERDDARIRLPKR